MPLPKISLFLIFQAPDQPARPFTTTQVTVNSNPDQLLLYQVDDQAHPSFQSISLFIVFLSQPSQKPGLLKENPPCGHKCYLKQGTGATAVGDLWV